MTEPKFTPGPWGASEHGDYSDYDGECIVVLDRDTRICVVQGSDDSETYHNAHLIAAAPELYEALEMLLRLDEEHQRGADDDDVCFEVRTAKTALAKARGESHD